MSKSLSIFLAVFALSAFCASASDSDLWISTYQYTYKDANRHWKVFEPVVYGGSGHFLFKYFDLPVGWDYYDSAFPSEYSNSLFIPKTSINARYQFGIKVRDLRYKTELVQYLVLIPNVNSIAVFTRAAYDPYVNFHQYFDFRDKDVVQLPSWKKIFELISEGDVTQLEHIINRVIKSDNSCLEKDGFLRGVLSRIEKFIGSGVHRIADLQHEIEELQGALLENQKNLDYLLNVKYNDKTLQKLKWELESNEDDLEFYLARAQYTKSDILKYSQSIEEHREKIREEREEEIPQLNNAIAELKQKLQQAEANPKNLDIVWWEFETNKIRETLGKKQKMLEDSLQDVNVYELKIRWFESKIKLLALQLEAQADEIKPLAEKVEALRRKIRAIEWAPEEIDALRKKIDWTRGLIHKKHEDIEDITKGINALHGALENFRKVIGKCKYDCRYVPVKAEKYEHERYEGFFDKDSFGNYLEKVYKREYLPERRDFRISEHYIYDDDWSKHYGACYEYGKDLFEEENECVYSETSTVEVGVIVRIAKNSIYVTVAQREVELRLQSCSVVQYAKEDGERPEKGDRIVWRGERKNLNNVYKVSHCLVV